MTKIIRIVDHPEEGVYFLDIRNDFVTYENQRWYICTSRVPGTCSETGIEYVGGTPVYQPTGNPGNRAQRLLPEAFARILGEEYQPEKPPGDQECDMCHETLPLTVDNFARTKDRKKFGTRCRLCTAKNKSTRKYEIECARRKRAEEAKIAGTKLIKFSDTWKPNREGARNGMKDLMGICSSLG